MNNERDHELENLLSAYLDGELPESQAAKVEKQLANDPYARELLGQLREVSHCISNLPRQKAPSHLAEDVLLELERHQLLNASDALSELAGKNHLRLRRFVAAAAMILLVGVVGTIVYQVLIGSVEKHHPETTPLVAKSDSPGPADIKPDTTHPLEPVLVNVDHKVSTDAMMQTDYANIHLEVCADTTGNSDDLEQLLMTLHIERFVSMSLNIQNQQYAFLCRAGQLAELYNRLEAPQNQIHIIIPDSDGNRQVTLTDTNQSDLLRLAMIADRSRQFTLANLLLEPSSPSGTTVAAGLSPDAKVTDRVTVSDWPANPPASELLRDLDDPQNLISDWLADALVKNEPELHDLQLLGPVDQPQNELPKETTKSDNAPLAANAPTPVSTVMPDEDDTDPMLDDIDIDLNQMVAIILTYKSQATLSEPQIETKPGNPPGNNHDN